MDEMLAALDAELQEIVVEADHAYMPYFGMFRYHLGWVNAQFAPTQTDVGKRIRPLLCLLSCKASGGDWQTALPLAAAIELVHNFSLIHDDIEDASPERRGRATVWKVWGIPQALNAGDGMFVLARLALNRLAARGVSAEKWAQISVGFDAATLELCQGQFLDLSFETRADVSVDDYLQMIHGKTAALVSAAAQLGAMLAAHDAPTLRAFADFGENVGLAFQMTDDILGIWGDPEITGKSAATDILAKKKSLPAIIALTHPSTGAAMRALYQKPLLADKDITRALELLDAANARAETQRRADDYCEAADDALLRAQVKNRAVENLRDLAAGMTRRIR